MQARPRPRSIADTARSSSECVATLRLPIVPRPCGTRARASCRLTTWYYAGCSSGPRQRRVSETPEPAARGQHAAAGPGPHVQGGLCSLPRLLMRLWTLALTHRLHTLVPRPQLRLPPDLAKRLGNQMRWDSKFLAANVRGRSVLQRRDMRWWRLPAVLGHPTLRRAQRLLTVVRGHGTCRASWTIRYCWVSSGLRCR